MKNGYTNPEPLGGEIAWCLPDPTHAWSDRVGSNDGTPTGVSVVVDRGSGGKFAGVFDGSAYVDLDTEIDFASDFAISFWKKGNSSTIFLGSASAAESVEQLNSTTIRCGFGTNADFTVPSNDAGWHHVLIARQSGTLRLYYDGEESSTGGIANTDTFHLGRVGGDSSGGSFVGRIDDVRPFDQSLAPSEVKELATKRAYQRGIAERLFDPACLWSPTHTKFTSDTTLVDFSGNGVNGTLTGGLGYVSDTTNGGRQALDFDGVNDCVLFGVTASPGGPFTWSADVYREGTGTQILFAARDNVSATGWAQFFYASGQYHFRILQSSGVYIGRTVSAPPAANTWHKIAVTWDGGVTSSSIKVFIDGVQADDGDDNAGTFTTLGASSLMFIGCQETSGTQELFFDGRMDNIMLHDGVLPDDQVKFLAGSRAAQTYEYGDNCELAIDATHDVWLQASGAELVDQTFKYGAISPGGGYTVNTTDTESYGEVSIDFDGLSGSNITVEDIPTFEATVELWVKIPTHRSFDYVFGLRVAGTTGQFYWEVMTRNGPSFRFECNGAVLGSNYGYTEDEWMHIVLQHEDGDAVVYMNGAEAQRATVAARTPGPMDMSLGSATASSNNACICRYSSALLHSRTFFPKEIEQRYQRGRWGRHVSYNQVFGTGANNDTVSLENNMLLQEASGTVALDRSVRKKNGLITGSPTLAVSGPASYLPNAMNFDAVDDKVEIEPDGVAGDGYWHTGPESILFGGWFYVDDSSPGPMAWYEIGSGSDGMAIGYDSSTQSIRFNSTTLGSDLASVSTFNLEWVHVALRYVGGVAELWVNGALEDSASMPPIGSYASDTCIGSGNASAYPLEPKGRAAGVFNFSGGGPAVHIPEMLSGPEPLHSVVPTVFTAQEGSAPLALTTAQLDEAFSGGTFAGLLSEAYQVWVADDEHGTNAEFIDYADSADVANLPPGSAGQYVNLGLEIEDSISGYDAGEVWWTGWTQIQSSVSGGVSETLGTGQSTSGGHALQLAAGQSVTLGLGESTSIGQAPTVTIGSAVSVTLGSGSSNSAGNDLSVQIGQSVTLGTGQSGSQGHPPTLTIGSSVNVTLGTGISVSAGSALDPETGVNVSILAGGSVSTGHAPTVDVGSSVSVTLGSGASRSDGQPLQPVSGSHATLGTGASASAGHPPSITVGGFVNVQLPAGESRSTGHPLTPEIGVAGDLDLRLRPEDLRRDELRQTSMT